MVQKLILDGRDVWLKRYEERSIARRTKAGLWNVFARELHAEPLRSPPRHAGEDAKRLEQRRIGELGRQGVNVPQIVGEGSRTLLMSDIGPTLADRLRHAGGDGQIDILVRRAAQEIAVAHGRDAYLGQAFARNITVAADGRVGFLDFEEDPLEVMSLHDAQARDWLLFTAGVSRYYESRAGALAAILGDVVLPQAANDVTDEVRRVALQLGFLRRCTGYLGRRARALGIAVTSLRMGLGVAVVLLGLLLDYLPDAELDSLAIVRSLL